MTSQDEPSEQARKGRTVERAGVLGGACVSGGNGGVCKQRHDMQSSIGGKPQAGQVMG